MDGWMRFKWVHDEVAIIRFFFSFLFFLLFADALACILGFLCKKVGSMFPFTFLYRFSATR